MIRLATHQIEVFTWYNIKEILFIVVCDASSIIYSAAFLSFQILTAPSHAASDGYGPQLYHFFISYLALHWREVSYVWEQCIWSDFVTVSMHKVMNM